MLSMKLILLFILPKPQDLARILRKEMILAYVACMKMMIIIIIISQLFNHLVTTYWDPEGTYVQNKVVNLIILLFHTCRRQETNILSPEGF